jgi:hypothetical protein
MEWNGKRQFFQFKIMFTDNLSWIVETLRGFTALQMYKINFHITAAYLIIFTLLKLWECSAKTCWITAWMAANTVTSVIVLPTWIWIPESKWRLELLSK